MNIYLVSRTNQVGYDEYDSFVCTAESEEAARKMHPSEYVTHVNNDTWMGTYSGGANKGGEYESGYGDWVLFKDIDKLNVELIGYSTDENKRIILSSFNAG